MRTRIEVSLLVVTGSVAPNGDLCAPVTGNSPNEGHGRVAFSNPSLAASSPAPEEMSRD